MKPAPLYPIPAVSQPFEHLIVDCVGPLPRSKAGNEYLLTVMCQVTRYPAVYPLRSLTAKLVVKALTLAYSYTDSCLYQWSEYHKLFSLIRGVILL